MRFFPGCLANEDILHPVISVKFYSLVQQRKEATPKLDHFLKRFFPPTAAVIVVEMFTVRQHILFVLTSILSSV